MNTQVYKINLEDFRTPGSKVFIGRPRGIKVREQSKIDSIEPGYDKIVISIPDDIASINPSFLEEFLYNVVNHIGETAFRQKFAFENTGQYKIDNDLTEAIERILREENALA